MEDQSFGEVRKKRRRVFKSSEERVTARKEKQKARDSRRICLGSAWTEWERQRSVCGGMGHVDFVHHLLAIHKSRCNTFAASMSNSLPNSSIPGTVGEVIPETPQKTSSTYPVIELPDQCSPILTLTYGSQSKQRSTQDDSSDQPSYDASRSNMHTPTSQVRRPTTAPGTLDATENETGELFSSTPKPGRNPPTKFQENVDSINQNTDSHEGDQECFNDTTNIQFSDDDDDPEDDTFWEHKDRHSPKLGIKMSKAQAIDAKKCIAYNDAIEQLLKACVGDYCKKCKDSIDFRHVKIGTCLVVKWKCPNYDKGHSSGTWASQPMLHGMYAGNLLVPASLALSGNNYAKVALMAKFLKLNFVSEAVFYRVQQKYVYPAVNYKWKEMQTRLLQQVTEPLVLAGDGRNDSPGYCAKYCTYTLQDVKTKRILALSVTDCRQTDLNSVIMEKDGFMKAMDQITPHAKVAEIVTDAHPQITALMNRDERFKPINHQYDVWHVSKSLGKKLAAAAREKGCKDILPWVGPIRNHLWYCSKECKGDAGILRILWTTCFYHVCDVHEWPETTSRTRGGCDHVIPLPDDQGRQPWIKAGSKAQKQLRSIIFDDKFTKKLEYIRNFRHTGDLELFNALILMYCPKRLAFTNPIYLMRNQLAAMDYNHHLDRKQAKNKKTGEDRYRSYYSKATKQFTAGPRKEPKEYKYISDIIGEIVNRRELAEGVQPLAAKVELHPSDPRRIQPRIAAIRKPPMEELISTHKSRFSN